MPVRQAANFIASDKFDAGAFAALGAVKDDAFGATAGEGFFGALGNEVALGFSAPVCGKVGKVTKNGLGSSGFTFLSFIFFAIFTYLCEGKTFGLNFHKRINNLLMEKIMYLVFRNAKH